MADMTFDLTQLEYPWIAVEDDDAFIVELRSEVTLGHVLYGVTDLRAIARREDRDDVLFVVNGMFAAVHLTYAGAENDPRWPAVSLYASWEEFIATRLQPDVAEVDSAADQRTT